MRARLWTSSILAAAAVVTAGCGGGGGGGGGGGNGQDQGATTASTASSPARAGDIGEASAVCTALYDRVNRIALPRTYDDEQAWSAAARRLMLDGADRLHGVDLPSGAEDAAANVITLMRAEADALVTFGDRARQTPKEELQGRLAVAAQTNTRVQAARDAGLVPGCDAPLSLPVPQGP